MQAQEKEKKRKYRLHADNSVECTDENQVKVET